MLKNSAILRAGKSGKQPQTRAIYIITYKILHAQSHFKQTQSKNTHKLSKPMLGKAHLTALNLSHFKMVEAMGLKIIA
jgi:hypothetical protein